MGKSVTPHILQVLCPTTPLGVLEQFVAPLNATFSEFGIDEDAERMRFLAQFGHETMGFTKLRENLNYNPAGILATFNTNSHIRFTPEQAEHFGRTAQHSADQMMIANLAYAYRYGNGGPESGDGWKFRGGALCHLTFRDNYTACDAALKLDLLNHPEIVTDPGPACRIGGWYWDAHGCGEIADFKKLTERINGGLNGYDLRVAYLGRAQEAYA